MGGASGHMKSLSEDFSLSFKEIKNIFHKISSGKMMVTEKMDGLCLHLSFSTIDGKARAARNYKNIGEGGVTLENVNLLTETQEIIPSLTEAIKTFENSIKKLNIDEQIDIFGPSANYYYNCEIIDPNNINVFRYDRPVIKLHRSGHLLNDKYAKTIVPQNLGEQFLRLENLLNSNKQLNEDLGTGFIIETNPLRKLDELKDKTCYQNALKSLENEMKKYSVSDKGSLAEYVLNRLDEALKTEISELPKRSKIELLKRLMKEEKTSAKDVYETLMRDNSSHLIEKVRNIINSERKYLKEAIFPIEEIVTQFGAGVLKEFKSLSIKKSQNEVERVRKNLQEIFDIVGRSGNVEAQNFLNNQFKRIKDINNINSACEGIVFKYNNNIYKLTGLFSPLNQILGMMNFPRGNAPALKTLTSLNENKTAVMSWGRFNPPTIGHEIIFKFGSDLAKENKAEFFIIPTKTVDKDKNPLTLQEKITYLNKIFPEYSTNIINSSQINTIIEAVKYISNKGFKNLKLVVGSDRKSHFEEVLNKYNNKDYNFKTIEIISAGERLDENEGAAGMSASKMRQAAIDGNIEMFMKGVAGRLELDEGIELMNLIRSRIEVVDDGKKKFLEPVSPSLLAEVIRKSGNKWCVFSKHKAKSGKKKKLGCYNSRNGAKKRLRQVEYFKSIKEQQELEETNAMSAGSVQGHVDSKNKNPWNSNEVIELEEENVEEMIDGPYNKQSMTSRFGDSASSSFKRDDEPSRKEIIKILIMQEEQFMIDRKEFIEEIKLRKIIREGLKRRIKERNQNSLKEEQQLRLVIRKVLNEKQKDKVRHENTGINLLGDLLKSIVPIIEDDYLDLTTNPEQAKSYRIHLLNGVKDIFRTSDAMGGEVEKEKVDVELNQEAQELDEDVPPEISSNPKFIPINKPKKIKPKDGKEVDNFMIPGLDITGANVAKSTLKSISNKIKDKYEILSDPKDKELFKDYSITNIKLYMDIFSNQSKKNLEEPTTKEYEKEKEKLDSNPPEAQATSQLPSSNPEQTPPQSPNPVMERKKR